MPASNENFPLAVEQAARPSLRAVLGDVELDELLSLCESSNARLQMVLEERTAPGRYLRTGTSHNTNENAPACRVRARPPAVNSQ